MINVSVILVNYKSEKYLLDCIKSLLNSKPKVSFEIIVVDNNDKDTLRETLKNKYPNAVYEKSIANLGYGGGNNLGAEIAKGEYIFILNPDTIVFKNTIDSLYGFARKNENIGAISPIFLDEKNIPFRVQGSKELNPKNALFSLTFFKNFFFKKNIYKEKVKNLENLKTPREVETVPGAAIFIRKEIFKKVNGFNEDLFLYFEENDFSNSLRKLGYKLYIVPLSKIIHKIGKSTSKVPNVNNIYEKSRFIYFKKNYGIIPAFLLNILFSVNKYSVSIFSLLLVALFLRLVNLNISMPFIGDQGWFYLSARDLLLTGNIPLVGITSSHIWLHQGPIWTYMLSCMLFLFNFNPISGAYLTAIFGVSTVYLLLKLGKEMFSVRVGYISAVLYAVSPFAVFFDRMPFDPSPIPFFTVLLIYSTYRWVNGSVKYFPLILFLIGILYNLELATFSLFFPVVALFLFGLYKRKSFVKKIFNIKIIFFSVTGFLFPMLPVIIYDFSNGFKQTFIFGGWILYKFAIVFLGHSSSGLLSNVNLILDFILISLEKIIFSGSAYVSLALFIFSILILLKSMHNSNYKIEKPNFILLLFLVFAFGGILINQTPSEAYLPILFSLIFFSTAILFDFLFAFRKTWYLVGIIFVVITATNFVKSYNNSFVVDFEKRNTAAERIISIAGDKKFNLIGRGEGSQFDSFTMNYEYLLWLKKRPVSKNPEKLKIIIYEDSKGIKIDQK